MTLISCSKLLTQTFLSTCLLIILLPLILPLLVLLCIWAFVVDVLIKLKYGHKAKRITCMDALFRPDTPKSTSILNIAVRFTGEMDVNKFRTKLSKLINFSTEETGRKRNHRLAQVVHKEFGYFLWKDAEDFDIDNHLQIIQLKELVKLSIEKELSQKNLPTNAEYIQELTQLCDEDKIPEWKVLTKCLLNEFGMSRIDQKFPQWQLIFLEESKERFTVLIRLHHSISDGIYFTRFVSEKFLEIPKNEACKFYFARPSKPARILSALWNILLIPITIANLINNMEDSNPLHGPKLTGKKKYYMSNSISLERIKSICKVTNSNVNGVLVSCLSSALSLHFKRRSSTQNIVEVRFPVPCQNLEKPVVLTNNFALISLKVPTPPPLGADLPTYAAENVPLNLPASSSLNRLQKIKSLFDVAKKDPTHMSVYYLIRLVCSVMPIRLQNFLLPPPNVTVVYSNVPGPQTPVHFENNSVENLMFWLPNFEPKLGVSMSVHSCKGQLRVGLVLDEVLLKEENEGDLILEDFENEVKNILKELDSRQNSMAGFECKEAILSDIP